MDDLDSAFKRGGSGWNQAASGYQKHHFWTKTRSSRVVRQGNWKPILTKPGYYKVAVKIPARNATSRKAKYRIKTADGWVTRVRNQKKRAGDWVGLGVHRLTAVPILKLSDKTGEAGSLGRRLAFDAARFEPASAPASTSRPATRSRTAAPHDGANTDPAQPTALSTDGRDPKPVRPISTPEPPEDPLPAGEAASPGPSPSPTGAPNQGDAGGLDSGG